MNFLHQSTPLGSHNSMMSVLTSLAIALFLKLSAVSAEGECFADAGMNEEFEALLGGPMAEGDCCQNHICAIPCPEEVEDPSKGK